MTCIDLFRTATSRLRPIWVSGLLVLLADLGCIKRHDPDEDVATKDQATPSESADETEGEAKRAKKGKNGAKKGGRNKKKGGTANKNLSSLGYVDGTVDEEIEQTGVVIHKRDRVWAGLNFYTSRNQARAQIIDMDGRVRHVWESSGKGAWQHATLLPDGDVIALVKDKAVMRVDKDSKTEWVWEGRPHHDLWVHVDGDIYVLSRRQKEAAKYHPDLETVEDIVVVLSPDGQEKRSFSVLETIEKSPYAFLLGNSRALPGQEIRRANPRPSKEFDILHTNHVEVFDGSLEAKSKIFAKGNILLCPRNIHTPMIVDGKTQEIVWLWGASNLIYPHHPTLTKDGNILIFSNGTEATGSQVVELNPLTNEIVWTYGPQEEFYSDTRGSNQRLPNGNTLITESDTGYVFEVDPAGEIVWQFLNPHVQKKGKMRMAIWRMTRFAPEALTFELNRK